MIQRIVIPYGYGQTCNQLLQISHWIPTSVETGIPVYFMGFTRYSHLFSGTAGQWIPRFPRTAPALHLPEAALAKMCSYAARVPHVNIGPFYTTARMLPGVVTFAWDDSGRDGNIAPAKVLADPKVAGGRSLWLRGWLYRDHAGFLKHRATINEFFSPTPSTRQRIDAFLRESRSGGRLLVGVHLRRTDYRKWAAGKFFLDDATYAGIMRRALDVLPSRNVRFVMMSDEPVIRDNYRDFDFVVGPGDPMGDLFSLAGCDYLIGPPSTFTSWASYVGNVPLYHIKEPSEQFGLDAFKTLL